MLYNINGKRSNTAYIARVKETSVTAYHIKTFTGGKFTNVKYTRGIWKVMHIHPYYFTQWSEKKDEGISVNIRIWGFWGYHFLMFALMR